MLDITTKKRIDDCRDILVGKLPDPKSQIEQITIALIYKFMDDMDKEAIDLGGRAKFFADYEIQDPNDPHKKITVPFEKYSWNNLFDPKISASEMLKLYSEAIEGMVKNPNIPELFSNIFKNAYLPYRDPETLKLFLKTISEFEYTHSEKLGDAFEYLLSVMGSQGDAGQFRTPRHIIDFLVKAVNPNKTDSILDPACGTAGFLISAFKHIKEQNKNVLTPDEQKKIIKNFVGYDISPDMVRLSLVNLYLHGFSDPHIFEYDSLSSEDRWNETFDVILANPPFMSPKGGIRPHKKFSISSNRSEVLFVDYIAEHLNPKGKAGIIVPEGIIFQSGTAYKDLRKMLVDNYLYAVVSLPAGVFNPYSGVKTSILLMDKTVAQKTNDILFIKIDNDGYNLGAQRNPIKGGQLEDAVQLIHEFVASPFKEITNPMAHSVPKTEISKSGDYNLSGERYKTNTTLHHTKYKIESLGNLVEILDSLRVPITKSERINGDYPYYGATGILDYVSEFIFNEKLVLIGEDGAKWLPGDKTAFIAEGKYWVNNHAHVLRPKRELLLDLFLVEMINYMDLTPYITGVTVPKLNQGKLKEIKIPLPPLSVQEEIVAEIASYQKIIDGAKMVVDHYKPRIEIDPSWEMVELKELTTKITDGTHKTPKYTESGIPFLRVTDLTLSNDSKKFISVEEHHELIKRCNPEIGDILYTKNGTVGVAKMIDWEYEFSIFVSLALIKPKRELIESKYLEIMMNTDLVFNQSTAHSKSGTITNLHLIEIKQFKIPLPNKETQQQIISQIENEQKLVNANKELIAIYEQKIKDRIGKVWGEKEQKVVSKKVSNDLYLAMMLKQMEKKIQLNYGEVATQKTVFHLNTFTSQKLDYQFINSNYGTYSYHLKDDLLKNPYLSKIKKGNGEVFVVTNSKEKEIEQALTDSENKAFVDAINEVLRIYQTPLINKETENIELLNTVSKVILDKQSIDLDVVYKAMQEWEINQNGFKTKADKFSLPKTKRMIDLIEKLDLKSTLIKKQ
ncbi:N-6 DNA methylase [Flavobacterium sp. CYK-55]|uniref:N-6 DNA methylase n=1 Tax=Flavobacterium sp. CYK-55 TaxID=2835529 RepID=UPI001BCBDCBC|nr:N-6 DNA methylase [Flavobacterium sp. CYK-55]MBS7787969.1 N-6 DNA methylase [Flavobacterium sp. CYK-55]